MTIVALLSSAAGCGDEAPYRPGPVADCVMSEVDNYVRLPRSGSADRPPSLRSRLPESALAGVELVAFRPFDVTFGEMVDGGIRSPAPAVFVFFGSEERAERYAASSDLASRNLLIFFERPPPPRQRQAIEDCL